MRQQQQKPIQIIKYNDFGENNKKRKNWNKTHQQWSEIDCKY